MSDSSSARSVGGSADRAQYAHRLTRRQLMVAGGSGLASIALAACAGQSTPLLRPLSPDGPEVEAAERARIGSGATVASFTVNPRPATVDLGGVQVDTWAYDGAVPGPLLTADAGQILEVKVVNGLPDPTTVHWHGLALRNDMDGVPGLTQSPIAVGDSKTYRFSLSHPGTYWFHPHVGTQLDRGLYAPLIINDPQEAGDYDAEHVIVLDDWLDGTGETPNQLAHRLISTGPPPSADRSIVGPGVRHGSCSGGSRSACESRVGSCDSSEHEATPGMSVAVLLGEVNVPILDRPKRRR